jgi:pilus assembly protein CpaB
VQRGLDGLPADGKIATLEVTPIEAERLAVAMGQGTIQLVLRGYGDPDSINTGGASSTDVLAALRDAPVVSPPVARAPVRRTSAPARPKVDTVVVAPPPAPARPDTNTVNIFRGNERTTQKFQKDSTNRPPQR